MQPIIQVNNISKQYRLGTVGTGSLHHDINRWWYRLCGKEDPYLRIGEANDRTQKSTSDYVWALQDIDFTVNPGEVLGIIGRNGAGKSTLLKILSRITAPSTGEYILRGRVASLLEVGTGMHPELTGRENIYLNGAILGMRRKEINRKLDAIVDFSGVERYLDTPVKRYSSGMHVRLGFAVAAHLEPDILIVDEVLAVGDVEFQKKCLGKMKDVSTNEGRTVLFVSHNMQAIQNLTQRCLVMHQGTLGFDGPTTDALPYYIQNTGAKKLTYENEAAIGRPSITSVRLHTSKPGNLHIHGQPLVVEIEMHFPEPTQGIALSFQIFDFFDNAVVHCWVYDKDIPMGKKSGLTTVVCTVPKFRLYMGNYYLTIHFANTMPNHRYEVIERICPLEISMLGFERIHPFLPDTCRYIEDAEWSKIN